MTLSEFAPAKLNLYLHVGPARLDGPRSDGLHPIESLAIFLDVGDEISLHSGTETVLEILPSRFSAALLSEPVDDNLVMKAARGFYDIFPCGRRGKLTLEKRLPVASGLGGGSADAAAILRLLAAQSGVALEDPRLRDLAARLGADVPACVFSRVCVMRGVGSDVSFLPFYPPHFFILLVNPGVFVSTACVFRKFDENNEAQPISFKEKDALQGDVSTFCAALKKTRNDLEKPAIAIAPIIQVVLEALNAQAGNLLSRMSGSGATCFAIFGEESVAHDAEKALRARYPQWWTAVARPSRVRIHG